MKTRPLRRIFDIGLMLMLGAVTAQPALLAQAYALDGSGGAGSAAPAQAQPGRVGVSQTIQGVTVTLAELRSRSQAANSIKPRQASPRRTFDGSAAPAHHPSAPAGYPSVSAPQPMALGPDLPQTLVDEIFGPAITDTAGFVPPDTMGAVGSIDFLFAVNGRFRAFTKALPHTQVLDTDQAVFWSGVADAAGVSDGHVRYDRGTQRWFITEIDVPAKNNHILLAVSSGPDLSIATWTRFGLPGTGATPGTDHDCFADYDTPGIDQNAIYIGANMFGDSGASPCDSTNYKHSNLYVIQKGPTLTGTAHLTTFYNVATGTAGIATIQGVDSFDSLPSGYAVAVKETESPRAHLNVWQINSPGTISPTLSTPTAVAISAENGSTGGVVSANNAASGSPNRPMDDIDDRLFSAVIRNGHLWTAHNLAVNSSGNSNSGLLARDAVRWYDVNVSGLTVNQAGTVFDGASSGYLEYWMGTVMVSGQGHAAMGLNRANSSTTVEAGAVGRLAGDALGTMLGFSRFQTSTADAYDDSGFITNPANRWGDYTYTSLDPCDDMTMWTTQEYVAGSADSGVDWGVAAEKLLAPPPATPSGAGPALILRGQPSVSVVVTGTSLNGSGFYDTPAGITDPCRQRLTATVSGNVTVTSITYTDPLHVQLNLSTVGSALGPQTVTITNPDGQAAGAALLTIIGSSRPTTTTVSAAPNPSLFGQSVTFTATVSGSPGSPTGSVTFYDGAPLASSPLLAGVATFVTNTLPIGANTITATYTGDISFLMSTAPPLTQTVDQAVYLPLIVR